ncbi:MAG: hypothetical protein JXL97_15125 [Bacteroidales bacterium]|nr:hypothetical protein [Bacteroidales bacterium]
MKKLLFTIALLIPISSLFAQTYDEKISYVRTQFSTIENNIDNYTYKQYIYQPEEDYPPYAYYDFWFDSNGELVKIQESMGEEGYYTERNYYFDDKNLFFYFSSDNEPGEESYEEIDYFITEYRVYFYNGEIFEFLSKYKDESDKRKISDIKNEKVEWEPEQIEAILELSKEAIEYSKLAE